MIQFYVFLEVSGLHGFLMKSLPCSCFEHFAQLWRLSIVQVVISDVSRRWAALLVEGEATLRPGAGVRWENH